MSLFSLRWIPLIAFIAAAGCGPLPRPFEPGSRNLANPLLQVQDSHGVVVAPIYDAPPEVATQLASLLAQRLGKHEIPTTATGVLNSGNLLEGWYKLENSIAGSVDVVVDWQLSDRHGQEILGRSSRIRVRIADLARNAWPIVDDLANEILPHLVTRLAGAPRPAKPLQASKAIAVGTITGAPGDGATALRRAFESVLARTGIGYSESIETALAVVDGKIEVSPVSNDTEQVKLVWTIRDSAQKEVAIFRQQNKIPKGRLSGRWGAIAFDIVLAMRGQILEAMRRLETSGNDSLQVPSNLK